MSSLYDDPSPLDGVIEQCVEALMVERVTSMQDHRLVGLSTKAFMLGGNSIPGRLATALQERSRGKFTVLTVDRDVATSRLEGLVFFVRAIDNNRTYEEPVTKITDGMVLCEINPYLSKLNVGVPHNEPDEMARIKVEREATERTEAQRAAKLAERRIAVREEYAHVLSRVELTLQRVPTEEALKKWALMRSPHTSHQGRITVEDLIELAFMLQMPVQNFFERPPITT